MPGVNTNKKNPWFVAARYPHACVHGNFQYTFTLVALSLVHAHLICTLSVHAHFLHYVSACPLDLHSVNTCPLDLHSIGTCSLSALCLWYMPTLFALYRYMFTFCTLSMHAHFIFTLSQDGQAISNVFKVNVTAGKKPTGFGKGRLLQVA